MKWPAAGALLILAGLTGCGSQYRPVINPITKTGPPSQPQGTYVAVFSQSGQQAYSADVNYPCPASAYLNPGVVTVLDSPGDSVAAQATLGNGPITFAMDPSGSSAFSQNCDGTLSSMTISGGLMSKNVNTSALLPGSRPINSLILSSNQEYIVEQGGPAHNAIAAMNSNPPELKTEISDVAPSVINLTGVPSTQRIYSISQGNTLSAAGDLPWGSCGTPSSVTVNGEADGIETSSNGISSRIPLGVCPVYGVASSDGRRAFILNRGSGTITVINTQTDQLDTINASPYLGGNGTINLCNGATPCNAGPVYADFFAPSNLLVVANYDNDTISVIDTSLVESGIGAGNDSPTFGKVLATIPVGHQPAALTVLQDPTNTRAYVANKGDGTVSVVSLTSFTPLSTITLPVHDSVTPQPRSIVSNYNYPEGKVYVSAQNSPYVTVIRTDTDVISAQILVQGNVADIHINHQYAALTSSANANSQIGSRSVGSGAP